MKKIGIIILFSIGLLTANSCSTKNTKQANIENEQIITVTGEVTFIENGKDGYTATIIDVDGKENFATISITNLNKNGKQFKRYNVGDKASVKGTFWKDNENKTYITVSELN